MQTTVPVSQPTTWWMPGQTPLVAEPAAMAQLLMTRVASPIALVDAGHGSLAMGVDGVMCVGGMAPAQVQVHPMQAYVQGLHPQQLGSAGFRQRHGLRYAYVAGAMANGITSTEMVIAMAREGMLGFFGAAGLPPAQVADAIATCKQALGDLPFGFNLIHSPNEPDLEHEVVDLYLREHVRLVSASAYLDVTLPLLRYRYHGIHTNAAGEIVCPNRVIGKVSREEVARHFLSPPQERWLRLMVEKGYMTQQEATLASHLPVAADLTAEADSGGHTDNQPTLVLLPILLSLRDELSAKYKYPFPIHIGLAGGIATPSSVAAAFAMGADFVLTGSVNQACVESGSSDVVRGMLAKARQADVMMAPAADMFEMGVDVQVLKWGTMFGVRARKLYEWYREYESLEALSVEHRAILERDYLRCSVEEAWEQTHAFFVKRDPRQNERAERDPKHKMALVFRSYLGRASRWANAGDPSRRADYQIWCGPAMGAFNQWVKGTFLEDPKARQVATVGLNLMLGASVATRVNQFKQQGIVLPTSLQQYRPLEYNALRTILG
jgi:PfaD family protein